MDPERDSEPPMLAPRPVAGIRPNPTQYGNSTRVQPRFSSLAVVSLVAGFISPVFIIACFLSVITSTIAIATGHIALYKIKRSSNQLDGRAVAIVGVVLGYISMALTIAFISFIITRPGSNQANSSSGTDHSTSQSRLNEAELSIISGSKNNVARGNSELARDLATVFARAMKRADEAVFTMHGKPGIQLSGGEYVTYGELHDDSCAFIVHVPSYRNFTKEAEETLNTLAWIAASEAVKDHLKKGDAIAVGLRGTMTYGDILIGTYTDDDEKLDFRIGSAKDLVPFFGSEGKRRLDIDKVAAGMREESAAEVSDSSPFTTSQPNEAISSDPFQPQEPPAMAEPVDATSESPKASFGSSIPSVETPIPQAEIPQVNSSPKSKREVPKREVPAFENRIPVSLLKSIDAQGWNIESMIFIQSGDQLVTGGLDQTISVFDTRSGAMLFRSERQEELGQVVSLALSKDGQTLFAGGSTGRVASFKFKGDGGIEFVKLLYKHNRGASCLLVSPTFPFVLSGGEDGTVAWQPYDERSSSLKIVQDLKRKVLAAHLFSDRNECVATDGQSLIHFSVKDSKVIERQKLGKYYARVAAFSPDGSRCAVSSGSDLKLFETATGEQINVAFASTGMIWSVMFHPTKPWLITGGRGHAIIWDLESAERLALLDARSIQYVTNLAVTSDGRTLALIPSSAGQSVQVFDLHKSFF